MTKKVKETSFCQCLLENLGYGIVPNGWIPTEALQLLQACTLAAGSLVLIPKLSPPYPSCKSPCMRLLLQVVFMQAHAFTKLVELQDSLQSIIFFTTEFDIPSELSCYCLFDKLPFFALGNKSKFSV